MGKVHVALFYWELAIIDNSLEMLVVIGEMSGHGASTDAREEQN